MANLAVITARGGSKRIPRKNIRDFCGKPIIAYSIEAALKSKLFDEVMVSTDDKEIAEISRRYGAKIPFFRSAENSNDFATTRDVLQEVLTEYKSHNKQFNFLCCIYPTAPFVTSEKLIAGLETLRNADTDRLEAVVKFEFPPQRSLTMDKNGRLKYRYPEYATMRTQDIDPLYHDAGQFYWYDIGRCFFTSKKTFSISALELSEKEVQDIDNESDWAIAEMKFTLLRG